MTRRYEIYTADCDVKIVSAEDAEDAGLELEDVAFDEYVLIIGNPWSSALAVTGTPEELRRFARRLSDTLRDIRAVIRGSVVSPAALQAVDTGSRKPGLRLIPRNKFRELPPRAAGPDSPEL